MKALLLANVGNSDLALREADYPKGEDGKKLPSRSLGEAVKADFKRYRDSITLPLLEPCLKFITEEQGIEYSDIGVCLFASDQDATVTDKKEWAKDTAIVAEVIQDYLNYKYTIAKKSVQILRIEGNPADYSNAFAFHTKALAKVKEGLKDHAPQIYLEISGGTPAMVSMLLLMGIETFGQEVITLYKDQSSSEPDSIDVSQKLFARKTRELLKTQLSVYAYGSAYQTFVENGQMILGDENQRHTVAQLLTYADRRLAFDFDRAREALRQIRTVGNTQSLVRHLRNELDASESPKLIAELVYLAEVKLATHQYAEFTQVMFRFQEAIFRYLAEQMGMKVSESGQRLNEDWRMSQPQLDQYLNAYRRTARGKTTDKPTEIKTDVTLNRYNLGAIVEYFVSNDAQYAKLNEPVMQIFRLSSVADLRNKGITGHGFEGIGHDDIQAEYGAEPDQIVADLKNIYQAVFETSIVKSPYEDVNTLIFSLIEVSA